MLLRNERLLRWEEAASTSLVKYSGSMKTLQATRDASGKERPTSLTKNSGSTKTLQAAREAAGKERPCYQLHLV